MNKEAFNRRRFLMSLGAGAALPLVPLFDAHAATDSGPRRLLIFFTTNGTIYEKWLPTMKNGALELSPILSPLEKIKHKLLVVDGLAHNVILQKGEYSGHAAGMNTTLVGRHAKLMDPSKPLRSLGVGISLDQWLGPKISADTKLKTLELGIQIQVGATDMSAISYAGAEAPVQAECSPYKALDRLFRGYKQAGATESASDHRELADRKAMLASVSQNLETASKRLSPADRAKMEAHLSAVRAIEHSLTTGAGAGASTVCRKLELGKPIDIWNNENIPQIAKLQMDVMAMAMACDLTRIGTIQFGRAGAQHRFNWLGPEFKSDPILGPVDQAKGFHALAHREADPETRTKLVRINTWYAEQFAYMVQKLDSIPERGGTMLDNTLCVWLNELGTGSHSHENIPYVIAGNAGKLFKTNRIISFPKQSHNRLLITLANAMGVETKTFGDPDFCKDGALTGLG